MNYDTTTPVRPRNCCRCGSEFLTNEAGRVCWECRKPRSSSRRLRSKELTLRESQVVDLVAQGKANKEIAYRLYLTEGTIKEYLNRIFRKVEVSNRTELAIWEHTRRLASAASNFPGRPAFES